MKCFTSASGKAKEMKGHAEAYRDMLKFLREMDKSEKHILVTLLEDLVGDTDTDSLELFAKTKPNKERLLNCVYNFLSDQFDYNATKPRSDMEQDSDLHKAATAAFTWRYGVKRIVRRFRKV